MSDLSRIVFALPSELAEEACLTLTDLAPQGWEESEENGETTFRIHLHERDQAEDISRKISAQWPTAAPVLEDVESCDWSSAWKEFFTPINCGERFEIVPPWLEDQADGSLTTIVIEPRMAFGTGHHPTTALCLEAMADLARDGRIQPGQNFLDLGTGSGILGVGLAKLGLVGLGLDIDPMAVSCAAENLETNGVADKMALAVGSLDSLAPGRTFDVVTANILSGPLISMAPSMAGAMAEGGRLILSGILVEQGPDVRQAYLAAGFGEPEIREQGEWCALIF
ncbi:MAG: 50S ribosomal protein L11 methyltransferase [Desulfovibrionaceae bacterium]